MSFKYKIEYSTSTTIKVADIKSAAESISSASLYKLKELTDFNLKSTDKLVPIAFDLAVINSANSNHEGISTEEAKKLAEAIPHHPINIEHYREDICGHAVTANFYSIPDHEKLEIESLSSTEKYYLSVGGILYAIKEPVLAKIIKLENLEDRYTISASWEIGYNEYKLLVGSKDFSLARELEESKYEEYNKYLKTNGGSGFDPNGEIVIKKIIGDISPIGMAITLTPAADVKGVYTPLEEEEDLEDDDGEEVSEDSVIVVEDSEYVDMTECECEEEDDEDEKEEEDGEEESGSSFTIGAKNVKLNKPFRTPGGPKKFSVYVKNDKGNVVKVNFGDPKMEIKRDDPERRSNFRARHNCDNPGPKWKARYWSCKMWSTKNVSTITKASINAVFEDLLGECLDTNSSKASSRRKKIEKIKEKLSHLIENNVSENREQTTMKLEDIKKMINEALASVENKDAETEVAVSTASRVAYEQINDALNRANEDFLQKKNALENLKSEAEAKQAQTEAKLQAALEKMADIESQLAKAQEAIAKENEAKELATKAAKLDATMADFDKQYSLSAEERGILLSEISASDLSDASIQSVTTKYGVLFASKKKQDSKEDADALLAKASASGEVKGSLEDASSKLSSRIKQFKLDVQVK